MRFFTRLQAENERLTDKNTELAGDFEKGYEAALEEMWDFVVEDTVKEILQEAEDLLHDVAMEYANAGHKDYFGVCENISWKVIRKIAKDKGVKVR